MVGRGRFARSLARSTIFATALTAAAPRTATEFWSSWTHNTGRRGAMMMIIPRDARSNGVFQGHYDYMSTRDLFMVDRRRDIP
jgi:hypothetical protein